MRRWWHIPRCIHMQESRLSTSSHCLQIPHSSKSISKPKKDSLKAVARPWKSPSTSIKSKQQYPSKVAARWNAPRHSIRIGYIAFVLYSCGVGIIYHFYWDCVPITGGKLLGWKSESVLQELDDLDRQRLGEIRENEEQGRAKVGGPVPLTIDYVIDYLMKASGLEFLLRKLEENFGRSVEELQVETEKGNVEVDGPALEMIASILNRLMKASGLDEMAWEVLVTNEPSM